MIHRQQMSHQTVQQQETAAVTKSPLRQVRLPQPLLLFYFLPKLTVIYGYDKMNKKVYPIKNELECISYSGIEITCNDLPIVKYNEVEGKLQGTCYGNLFFKDEKGATHSEDFTKYFVLEP